MNNATFLKQYRETWLELRVMERQLAMSGTTGRPRSAGHYQFDDMPRGTNAPTAAAIQQQDGIEAAVRELRDDLARMEIRYDELMKRARNYRDRCILRQYYQHCQTDAQVAECLNISVRHANRLRTELLCHLDNTSSMSEAVVVCPRPS